MQNVNYQKQIKRLNEELTSVKEQLEALKHENERLKKLCDTDELTGLYNWRCFNKKLKHEVARNKRQGHSMCLMFFDVDGLKSFNDTYGHSGGNDVLKAIAESIRQSIRNEVDSAYRFGGDEFAVILPEVQTDKAFDIAERIVKRLSEMCVDDSLSFGIAGLEPDMDDENLLKCADEAMYKAKGDVDNKVCVYGD